MHPRNSSTPEAEAGGLLQVQDQSGLHLESLILTRKMRYKKSKCQVMKSLACLF